MKTPRKLSPRAREVNRVRAAKWRAANPDRARALVRRWHKAHPERRRANGARYRLRHPDVAAALGATLRARERAATPKLTVFERAAVLGFYAVAKARTVQTGVQHHVDHIIPLARGGLHHPSNLQVLTAAENCAKGAMVQ